MDDVQCKFLQEEGPSGDFLDEGALVGYIKKSCMIHVKDELLSKKVVAEFSDTKNEAESLSFRGSVVALGWRSTHAFTTGGHRVL